MFFIVVFPRLFAKNFRGMSIYPFIFLRDKATLHNPTVIFHERIHLRQQLEMLWIPFFVWYLVEFLIRWVQYRDSHQAYLNICFEREAYSNEKDTDYLNKRSFWRFTKYL